MIEERLNSLVVDNTLKRFTVAITTQIELPIQIPTEASYGERREREKIRQGLIRMILREGREGENWN